MKSLLGGGFVCKELMFIKEKKKLIRVKIDGKRLIEKEYTRVDKIGKYVILDGGVYIVKRFYWEGKIFI